MRGHASYPVDARLIPGGTAGDPGPFICKMIVPPEVIEEIPPTFRVPALPAEEPEPSLGIGPGHGGPSRSGNIQWIRDSSYSVSARLIAQSAAGHPSPRDSGWCFFACSTGQEKDWKRPDQCHNLHSFLLPASAPLGSRSLDPADLTRSTGPLSRNDRLEILSNPLP